MDLFVGVFCGNKLVLLVVCVVAGKSVMVHLICYFNSKNPNGGKG